jgi:hypothetical protein
MHAAKLWLAAIPVKRRCALHREATRAGLFHEFVILYADKTIRFLPQLELKGDTAQDRGLWNAVCSAASWTFEQVKNRRNSMLSQRVFYALMLALPIFAVISLGSTAQKPKDKKPSGEGTPVIWRDPGNIAEKDLYWGSGSEDHAPKPPFAFKS